MTPAGTNVIDSCVFVLGMHRSGTSALTGLLAAYGANPGTDLLPGNDSNPKGFFESKAVVDLNNEILLAAGSSWDDLTPLPVDWLKLPEVQNLKGSIASLFASDDVSNGVRVIKDPRLSLTLPLWLDVLKDLGIQPKVVICIREPDAVAQSERLMKGFPILKSLLLYMTYGLQAELHSRHLPRVVVSYENLLADWEGVLKEVDGGLDLGLSIQTANSQNQGNGFISSELNRSELDANEFKGCGILCEMSSSLYHELQAPQAESLDELRKRFVAYQPDIQPWAKLLHQVQVVEERFPLANFEQRYSSILLKSQITWAAALDVDFDTRNVVAAKWANGAARQSVGFKFVDPSQIEKIRLSFVNKPSYVRLHSLVLQQGDVTIVRWGSFHKSVIGKSKNAIDVSERADEAPGAWVFIDSKGFVDLKSPGNQRVVVEPGCRLVMDIEVGDTSAGLPLVVSKLSQLQKDLSKLRKQAATQVGLSVNGDSIAKLTSDLTDLYSLLDEALAVRDQKIIAQQHTLEQMRDELLRAEAQLDLLKDLMIGHFDEH